MQFPDQGIGHLHVTEPLRLELDAFFLGEVQIVLKIRTDESGPFATEPLRLILQVSQCRVRVRHVVPAAVTERNVCPKPVFDGEGVADDVRSSPHTGAERLDMVVACLEVDADAPPLGPHRERADIRRRPVSLGSMEQRHLHQIGLRLSQHSSGPTDHSLPSGRPTGGTPSASPGPRSTESPSEPHRTVARPPPRRRRLCGPG